MYILGINAFHGNASAALICDGQLVAAAEEERFSRVKYAAGFPACAVRYCLEEGGIDIDSVAHVAIPRNPWARLARKLLYAARLPRFAVGRMRAAVRFATFRTELARALEVDPSRIAARLHRIEHHLAHLASAFLVSPFEQAAVLSADGLGDFASTMWATGQDNRLHVHGSIAFPHSLGMCYSAVSQYLGFRNYGDEYKVMGLSAYGEPIYRDEFERILQFGRDPSFRLGLEYFLHHVNGAEMTWREADRTPSLGRLYSSHLERRLGPSRQAGEPLERFHQNVAATLQVRLEEVLLRLLNGLHARTHKKDLCLAGGVAFNCVANGKICRATPFERIYVQPAAGDAGLAVGAAFYVYHQVLGFSRTFVMDHAYWGPGFSSAALRQALDRHGLPYRELADAAFYRELARHVAEGKIVGWFQGRMEWGPRALGNRSIVVDPRRPEMKEILNARVKHREAFRPFAPSILEESTAEYFDRSGPSPFMALAHLVRPQKQAEISATTHVDGTARLHTVRRLTNPRYWRLIKEFEHLTGVPALLNTSFNDNEPIVCTPDDAVSCFLRTKLDALALGNYVVLKDGVSSTEATSVDSTIHRGVAR